MELLTGVINNTERPVLFSSVQGEYRFCFMTDSVLEFGSRNSPVKVSNIDGFIFGRTHNNQRIAIYSDDNDLNILGTQMLNTGAYVISNGNITPDELNGFSAISFSGGSLNRVFRINGIDFDYTLKDGSVAKLNDDSRAFDIVTGDSKIHIEIRSCLSFADGQDGKTINNSDVSLTLSFDKIQPLSDIFKHYNIAKRVLSFMSFRKNVGFESIELLRNTDDVAIAKVYVNESQELALKDYQRNITVEDLGEAFPELIRLFYDTGERSPAPQIGFLPENDKDLNFISNSKLREICSAIENELDYISDIKVEENKQIEELKSQVKDTIKTYKDRHPDFPDGAVSLVNSSVSTWSLSLGERINALCEKYKTEIGCMSDSGVVINKEAVKEFVKYRHMVTHGNTKIMTTVVAETAFVLSGVVYCCVLDRIGVPRAKIEKLAQYKLLK